MLVAIYIIIGLLLVFSVAREGDRRKTEASWPMVFCVIFYLGFLWPVTVCLTLIYGVLKAIKNLILKSNG